MVNTGDVAAFLSQPASWAFVAGRLGVLLCPHCGLGWHPACRLGWHRERWRWWFGGEPS
jgi:hypothetical protein